jgi:hypothetical protein
VASPSKPLLNFSDSHGALRLKHFLKRSPESLTAFSSCNSIPALIKLQKLLTYHLRLATFRRISLAQSKSLGSVFPFLQGKKTAIESAALADLPVQVDNEYKNINITFPQAVQFVITAQLSDTPATQQLLNLARNGAIGVVTRINTLKRQGAIQP